MADYLPASIIDSEQTDKLRKRLYEKMEDAGINEDEVIEEAQEERSMWNTYFSENITRGKDDINFALRDQWTAVERSEFTRLFKPALTFNKIYDPIKKILAEQRQNKPDLMIRSLTGKAKQQQIDMMADMIRTIAYSSQTDLVYQTAFKSALLFGYGAFQIGVDFESPMSFKKIIKYDIIPDPIRAAFDPAALLPHKGDGNYCSRTYTIDMKEFFATYPYASNPVSFMDADLMLNLDWQMMDTISFCDRFVKKWFPLKIYMLSNGRVIKKDDWKKVEKEYADRAKMLEGSVVADIVDSSIPTIVSERQTQDYNIIQFRLLQNQILDFEMWPSKHLPIIFNDGDSYYIEGKQFTKSFVHEAKDAQKCVNYFGSEIAGEIKNRRREQWMGTPDNIRGQEQTWRNPEQEMGILLAVPDPRTGQMPQKMPPWELSQTLMQNFQRAGQDIREIMGFSENENLQGRDMSGKARRERKMEGGMSAYVFKDNLDQAIEQGGRVSLDLLPYVYSEEDRYVNIRQRDGKTRGVTLNKRLEDGSFENKLDSGEYDIEISTGPSFSVQKDIALEFLQETIANNPQAFSLVADLWARNLDVQFMPQLAERLSNLVPQEILAKEKGEQPKPKPPSPQEMMMQKELELKQQEIQARAVELKLREEKHELEKVQIASDAQKIVDEMHLKARQQHIDVRQLDMDFAAKIAKIIADKKDHNKESK